MKSFNKLGRMTLPEEIEKLIELVENGILKEEGDSFVVRGSEDSESDELGMKSF